MDTNKARFWETEKELRELIIAAKDLVEATEQALMAQLPIIQDLFGQLKQLGKELGYQGDDTSRMLE